MIPKNIKEQIEALAYKKWQGRKANGEFIITDKDGNNPREINAQDDWIEAEDEILKKAMKDWG